MLNTGILTLVEFCNILDCLSFSGQSLFTTNKLKKLVSNLYFLSISSVTKYLKFRIEAYTGAYKHHRFESIRYEAHFQQFVRLAGRRSGYYQ